MYDPEQQRSPVDSLELAAKSFANTLNVAEVNAQIDPSYDLYVSEPENTDNIAVRTAIVRMWTPGLKKLRERDFFVLRETTAYARDEYSAAPRVKHHMFMLTPLSAEAYNDKRYIDYFPAACLRRDADEVGIEHTSFYAAHLSVAADRASVQEVRARNADGLASLAESLHPVNLDELSQRAVKKIPRVALRAKEQLAGDIDVMALLEQQATTPNMMVAAYVGAAALQG